MKLRANFIDGESRRHGALETLPDVIWSVTVALTPVAVSRAERY